MFNHIKWFLVFLPLCSVMPVQAKAPKAANAPKQTYELKVGKGLPVCEAYLNRLNTQYTQQAPSPCEAFDEGIPGLSRVQWEEMPAAEHEKYL